MISFPIPASTRLTIIAACLLLQQTASALFNPVPYALPESFGSNLGHYAQFLNADLDADGKQDAVALYAAKGVYWRRALGATDLTQPLLGPPERLAVLGQVRDLVRLADLDGDGYPDMVCAVGSYPSHLYWLRNLCGETGTVAFDQTPRTISMAFTDAIALFVEDIDSDGDIDVITGSNFGSESFHVHPNQLTESAATFGAPVLLFGQGRYLDNRSISFHDYDSDGDLDVSTTLSLPGSISTVVWLENKLHDLSEYTLVIPPHPLGPEDLPASSPTPQLVVASIQNELWVRLLKPGSSPVTFRESQLSAHANPEDLALLKADFEVLRLSGPDPFVGTQFKKRLTKITGHKSGAGIQFTLNGLFSGVVPGSVQGGSFRYYTPEQYISADLDGDGDTDFFTAYTGSYGPMMGWFENRLNDRNHQNFSGLQLMNIDLYGGEAVIADLDGNHLPDLIFQGTDATLRVLYDFRGLRDGLLSWSEVVKKHGFEKFNTNPISLCTTIDLDGDGDLEILSDLGNFTRFFLLVSENLGPDRSTGSFDRHETQLLDKLPPYDSYPYLRAADRNGDGYPDLSMGGTHIYRNRYSSAPAFDFTQDTSLGEIPAPPAVPTADFAPFDQWHEAQPWQRTGRTISRLLADIDLDGDQDVVMLHGVSDGPTSISWFENRTVGAPDYRGPLGISGNVDASSKMICVDFDSDGDPDVLATGYHVDIIKYPRVIAFRNRSSNDAVIDRLVEDNEGFHQNSVTNPSFSATLKSSSDLNWETAETVDIPAPHLGNPAAMKHHMKWLDPLHEKRFFRLEYKIAK